MTDGGNSGFTLTVNEIEHTTDVLVGYWGDWDSKAFSFVPETRQGAIDLVRRIDSGT